MAKTKKPNSKPAGKPKETKDAESRIVEIPGQVSLQRSPFKLKGEIKYLLTDIDALHSYVLEKKTVSLADAAKRFKASKKNVEDWGRILEDHRMIEMHYPVAGEPTLMVPGLNKAKNRKDKSSKKKKEKKHGKPRFTKKRILITGEIIVLGEILIYIFLVNPHLRMNFIPTLNYQLTNLPANIMNLPNYLSGINFPINPAYILAGVLIVALWIILILIRKRKKKSFTKDWKKRHEKKK